MRDLREKSSPSTAIAALFCLFLLLLGVYVTGYLRLSTSMQLTMRINGSVAFEGTVRCFDQPWLARMYIPAAAVEGIFARENVAAGYRDDEGIPKMVGR
jgi:hypothetical protein